MKSKATNADTPSPTRESDSTSKKPKGQKRSLERGSATNNKKNPGKRASQGGN